jgi:acetyltransferase-like isoleucine patch superfamily enzyme
MTELEKFRELFSQLTDFKPSRFHPLVWIVGEPEIGKRVYIGGFSEVNAVGISVVIGDDCDIASFVSINCADSHKKCLGVADNVEREDIVIGNKVFSGSHSMINHSVVAAGTIVDGVEIPPYSLVAGNPMRVKPGYYLAMLASLKATRDRKGKRKISLSRRRS